ncbi:MAG: AAA family ATPase, partial [Spartobacteria bacterium]|nr:AAA family ATPase [Spartobacteria bacterium]
MTICYREMLMKDNSPAINIMLKQLRLGTLRRQYELIAKQAVQEGWSYPYYLQALCETELAERERRRIERLLKQSRLPASKSLDTLNRNELPDKVQRQLAMLLDGGFVERAENVLVFGLPGRGKTHLVCAIARELLMNQQRTVYFNSTFHLVQQMLIARRELALETLLKKLDRFD